ncbi:hypothetical protein G7Y89_g6114 [Cudoniella acicularis]|uniref:Cyclin N-terminal domain-containing protein n=1 Tax=Cudoniella acicularis TaxID=354080 RepID=A0A8H4RND8_9HELO|nr:hypothetical protein G7Y89_g6114 [Cudoniella acicularis]
MNCKADGSATDRGKSARHQNGGISVFKATTTGKLTSLQFVSRTILDATMDPLSITTSVLSIVGHSINAVQSCQNYATKYNLAGLSIAALRTECSSIRVALLQIHSLIIRDPDRDARDRFEEYVLEEYNAVLGACSLTFAILNERLEGMGLGGLDKKNTSDFSSKWKYMWNESQMDTIRQGIRGQALAINLLLTAFQSDAESLQSAWNQRQSTGDDVSTTGSMLGDEEFSFDDIVINSKAYRRVFARQQSKHQFNNTMMTPDSDDVNDSKEITNPGSSDANASIPAQLPPSSHSTDAPSPFNPHVTFPRAPVDQFSLHRTPRHQISSAPGPMFATSDSFAFLSSGPNSLEWPYVDEVGGRTTARDHGEEQYDLEIATAGPGEEQHDLEIANKTLPDVTQIDSQPEIQWFMRPYLMDFLVEAHAAFELLPQTLFLAVNLMDRYSSKVIVYKRHYQLVGCAALLIAAKYRDKKERVPMVRDLKSMCCSLYDEFMFIEMERHVLSTLEWIIRHPVVDIWMKPALKGSSAHDEHMKVEHMSWYLCELALFHKDFVSEKPSVMARASLALSCEILGRPTPDGLESDDQEVSKALARLSQKLGSPTHVLSRKYSSPSWSNVSFALAEFASKRLEQTRQVS